MNIIQITERFPSELAAIEFFERRRWGKKPKCAYCKSDNVSRRTKDFRFKCYDCDKTSGVTVNTHLHKTRIPLKTWLLAFSIITDAKKGLSALQLQRNLDISYPTAFKMYHKIRDIMTLENISIELDGILEMDETYIGPRKPRPFNTGKTVKPSKRTQIPELDERIEELKEEGINFKRGKGNPAKSAQHLKRGRGTLKIPVVGIVERDGNVVAEVMRTLTYENLKAMVQKYVDEDQSVLVTDQLRAYNKIQSIIEHVKIDHERLYSYKGVNTNTIESFWAIIERQIMGQHHHVSVKYLPKYVAETVFKFNNRHIDDMFETLVKKCMLKTLKKIA